MHALDSSNHIYQEPQTGKIYYEYQDSATDAVNLPTSVFPSFDVYLADYKHISHGFVVKVDIRACPVNTTDIVLPFYDHMVYDLDTESSPNLVQFWNFTSPTAELCNFDWTYELQTNLTTAQADYINLSESLDYISV